MNLFHQKIKFGISNKHDCFYFFCIQVLLLSYLFGLFWYILEASSIKVCNIGIVIKFCYFTFSYFISYDCF